MNKYKTLEALKAFYAEHKEIDGYITDAIADGAYITEQEPCEMTDARTVERPFTKQGLGLK